MRLIILLLLLLLPTIGTASDVFRCSEPRGVSMWSVENHKIVTDKFAGVKPVVIVDDKEMTIVWGDSKSAGGADKVWKALIFYRSENAASGAVVDDNQAGSASTIYTIDFDRGYLYMSSHKNYVTSMSGVISFVAKCIKSSR